MRKYDNWKLGSALMMALLALTTCRANCQASGSASARVVHAAASPSDSWIYDGVIYETHPSYYVDPANSKSGFDSLTLHLKDLPALGVKTVYLMSCFAEVGGGPANPANHIRDIYDVQDYQVIDTFYGTSNDLMNLVNRAHSLGLKVLFDLCLNHTRQGSFIYNQGWIFKVPLSQLQQVYGGALQMSGDSVWANCSNPERCGMAGILVAGDSVVLMHYPRSDWGIAVDYTNPGLISYITGVCASYVKNYGIDGWRIDAPMNNYNPAVISGDHSIMRVLRSIRDTTTQINPAAIIYSEEPGTVNRSSPDIDSVADISYSHDFTAALFLSIIPNGNSFGNLFSYLSNEVSWNGRTRSRFDETHDMSRIDSTNPGIDRPLLVMISTIPGIPMIQAGEELGMTKSYGTEIDWPAADSSLLKFYRKVFSIRNNSDALKFGSIVNVWKEGDSSYAYLRSYGNEKALVLINLTNVPDSSVLSVPFADGTSLEDSLTGKVYDISDSSNFAVEVPAESAMILFPVSGPTAVRNGNATPKMFVLDQNYPNPFNPTTLIGYQLPVTSNVKLKVFDVLGRVVATLVDKVERPGSYEVRFDGRNLPSGVYFYRLQAGNFGETRKLLLLK